MGATQHNECGQSVLVLAKLDDLMAPAVFYGERKFSRIQDMYINRPERARVILVDRELSK